MQERLTKDLTAAMRSRDQARMETIRQVKGAVTYEEIRLGTPLTDAQVEEVIGRLVRQHRESIDMFTKGNRPELADKEKAELEMLLAYLPQQLTPDQLKTLVTAVATEVGARGPSDKGKVMGKLMPQIKGKAEGKAVNDVVMDVLTKLAG